MKPELTYEEAHRIFDYEPRTGFLKWKLKVSDKVVVGNRAGTPQKGGRRYVKYNGKFYLTYRVIWLMMTGAWPTAQIDHINKDPSDDKFENLREASHIQNCWNSNGRSDSSTGVKGVFMRRKGKFQTEIQVDKKKIHLGTFNSLEEAAAVYRAAAKKFHGKFFSGGAD